MPGLKETLRASLPDHQSQEVLPGLIQDVSEMALGGFGVEDDIRFHQPSGVVRD